MKILFQFPSRSRAVKFFDALDNIEKFVGYDNYVVHAVLDEDDLTMNNAEVKNRLRQYPKVIADYGVSGSKIAACNRMTNVGAWDIGILQSDDQVWARHGFGREIVEDYNIYFKNGKPGVLHYPDGITGNKLITLSILNRTYYDLFGYWYFNGYRNVYSDNEFTEVSKLLGAYRFVNKSMYLHAHPVWGFTDWDQQYRESENSAGYLMDGNLFKERQANLFGLKEMGLL